MIELRSHQQKAVEKARNQPHLALFHEAGTGKTGTMIRILAEDYNGRKKLANTLIFAPLTVCAQWPGEFSRFSKVPEDRILCLTGSGIKRVRELLKARARGGNYIVITNFEAVQITEFYKELLRWSPEILVLDESHRIKDSQSKRAKLIYPLAHAARRRFLLTGTPVVNSLTDVFGQFKALNPNIFGGGFWSFRSKYFYDRNAGKQFSFPDWVPHTWASKEIGKVLSETSVQAKRSECLDLPPLSTIPVPYDIEGAQLKAYAEMKKEFMTEVDGQIMSSEFAMVKTLRMQQILAGFIQPDEKGEPVWFKEQPRLKVLMDLLDSIGKEKSIIWTTFKPTYKLIGDALEKEKIKHAFLTGEQTQAEKQSAIEDFKSGSTQILVANPAAASEGINLQEAKYAIYFMRSWNLLHYLQSLARNYRSGTEALHDRVVHYQIYSRGTLDEVVAGALHHKKNVGDTVLRWSRGDNTLANGIGPGYGLDQEGVPK